MKDGWDSLRALLAITILGFLVAVGCHRGDTPPLGKVEGSVTIKGVPLKEGRIFFIPQNGGRTSEGEIVDGKFRLAYTLNDFGAVVGEHAVKISTQNEFGGGERIPDRYNAETELKATVKRGQNQADFDLAEEVDPRKTKKQR